MHDRASNLRRRHRHPAHRSRVAAAIASGAAFVGLIGCTAIASTDDGSSTTTTDATAATDSTTAESTSTESSTTTDASQYSDPEWGGSATAGSGSGSGRSSTQSQGS